MEHLISAFTTYAPIIGAIATVGGSILAAKTYFRNESVRRAEVNKQIQLKSIEMEEAERIYRRDREILFRKLGGYVREGTVFMNGSLERFRSYEDERTMVDFDTAQKQKMEALRAEWRHLLEVNGDTGFVIIGDTTTSTGWSIFWKRLGLRKKSRCHWGSNKSSQNGNSH